MLAKSGRLDRRLPMKPGAGLWSFDLDQDFSAKSSR
jgi:hypothetical protein